MAKTDILFKGGEKGTATTPTTGDVLTFNGTEWDAAAGGGGGGGSYTASNGITIASSDIQMNIVGLSIDVPANGDYLPFADMSAAGDEKRATIRNIIKTEGVFTDQSVIFAGATGALTENNGTFFYDYPNDTLNFRGRFDLYWGTNQSIYIGHNAGNLAAPLAANGFYGHFIGQNCTGASNVVVCGAGQDTFVSATSCTANVIMGDLNGSLITTGSGNVSIGYETLYNLDEGNSNVCMGSNALLELSGTSSNNTAIGTSAMLNTTTGDLNTAIGWGAGGNLTSGNNNVFLGKQSGHAAGFTCNDRLYIHNSGSTSPMIGGDFSGRKVGINADLTGTLAATLNVVETGGVNNPVLRLQNNVSSGEIHVSTTSPEGAITADPGDICLSETGHLYIKRTGTGNTGWIQAGPEDKVIQKEVTLTALPAVAGIMDGGFFRVPTDMAGWDLYRVDFSFLDVPVAGTDYVIRLDINNGASVSGNVTIQASQAPYEGIVVNSGNFLNMAAGDIIRTEVVTAGTCIPTGLAMTLTLRHS